MTDKAKLTFQQLLEKLSYLNEEEIASVKDAYRLALLAHKDQYRKSGDPYIIHPLHVAMTLADLEMDKESIIAGILHDLIEDTDYGYEFINANFGEEIAVLVEGVTNLGKLPYSNQEERQADNFRKMFMAMAKDIRVILIKLADRLHNMRTLMYMPDHKKIEKSQEVIDIYAPLASRLGISKIKGELEDLAFKYLYPEDYKELSQKIQKKQSERMNYIHLITDQIKSKMEESGISGTVEGRPKHFFSIYKKMHNQNKSLDQIFDLFAIRVIVNSTRDCYAVLGIVHDMYKPMPGRFKDYIAMPKNNMYQSIHNTLMGPSGDPFEIQIRTKEMHKLAEFGIAAHWIYKENKHMSQISEKKKLAWLKELMEWQNDLSDNREFMDAVKGDFNIYNDQVYVFTPKGEVFDLPKGSTPIDFAYKIHSAIGNKMVSAKVNGRIVPFDYVVKNGDRIEILTSNNSSGPSNDWLKLVKSSQARNKIKQWFKQQSKTIDIQKGKDLLEKHVKKKGFTPSDLYLPEWIQIVLNKFGFSDWDSLAAAVGHGGLRESQVINRFIEEYEKQKTKEMTKDELLESIVTSEKKDKVKHSSGIWVKGIELPFVRFPRCCSPVPGDEIVCFVTRGRGGTIHRTDCINIIKMEESERERLLEAEWAYSMDDKNSFRAELKIVCIDKKNLIVEMALVFSEEEIEIMSMNVRSTKDGNAVFHVIIDVNGKKQLDKIMNKLRKVRAVLSVERTMT